MLRRLALRPLPPLRAARRLRRGLVITLALATCVAGAGLGIAQEVGNTTGSSAPWSPPAPASPPAPGAPAQPASPDTLQAPPEEAAPPPEAAPPEPAPPPANTTAKADVPDVPVVPPPPPKRPRYEVAVLQALDKVSAQTLRFEAKVNEPVRYKNLVITVHACETAASDETANDSVAHLEVSDQPDVLPGRAENVAHQVFRGWMYAGAPGLHPFEHPIYDVWVIACKTPAPAAPAADPSL